MTLRSKPETHQSLLRRIPDVTGRTLRHWLDCLDAGPGLVRFDERVNWLRDQHALPHAYAGAIVHEQDLRRAALRVS